MRDIGTREAKKSPDRWPSWPRLLVVRTTEMTWMPTLGVAKRSAAVPNDILQANNVEIDVADESLRREKVNLERLDPQRSTTVISPIRGCW
jgi:hypothetical protein